jgi:hypothetical protein
MIDFKFGFTWIMDKLGYMPKIDVEIGKVNLKAQDVWPFPIPKEETPIVKKRKPAVKKATTAAKKAK